MKSKSKKSQNGKYLISMMIKTETNSERANGNDISFMGNGELMAGSLETC